MFLPSTTTFPLLLLFFSPFPFFDLFFSFFFSHHQFSDFLHTFFYSLFFLFFFTSLSLFLTYLYSFSFSSPLRPLLSNDTTINSLGHKRFFKVNLYKSISKLFTSNPTVDGKDHLNATVLSHALWSHEHKHNPL